MKPPIKKIWNGDYKCINLDCERDIPEHIVEKQFKAPKYRVCVRCRNFKDVRWKCVGCGIIIDDNDKITGGFYCSNTCRTSRQKGYEKLYHKRWYNIKKLVANINTNRNI
jgi:hypothetical protein